MGAIELVEKSQLAERPEMKGGRHRQKCTSKCARATRSASRSSKAS